MRSFGVSFVYEIRCYVSMEMRRRHEIGAYGKPLERSFG
jgi:hypothetical protein